MRCTTSQWGRNEIDLAIDLKVDGEVFSDRRMITENFFNDKSIFKRIVNDMAEEIQRAVQKKKINSV